MVGLVISEPRIVVSVRRSHDDSQNDGSVVVYNLAPQTANRIIERGRGQPCTVEAGYPGRRGIIYAGSVARARQTRDNDAWVVNIGLGPALAGDVGKSKITYFNHHGLENVREIVADMADVMGLATGPLDAIPASAELKNYYWGAQSVRAGLNSILGHPEINCTWSVDNEVLYITRKSEPRTDAEHAVVSQETGMIGVPIPTDEGWQIRTRLDPRAQPKGIVTVSTSTIPRSLWTVRAIEHSCDNWDGPFETELDLIPIPEISV